MSRLLFGFILLGSVDKGYAENTALTKASTDLECLSGLMEACESASIGLNHVWKDFGFGDKHFAVTIGGNILETLSRDVVRRFQHEIELACEFLLSVSAKPPLVKIGSRTTEGSTSSSDHQTVVKIALLGDVSEKLTWNNDTGTPCNHSTFEATNPIEARRAANWGGGSGIAAEGEAVELKGSQPAEFIVGDVITDDDTESKPLTKAEKEVLRAEDEARRQQENEESQRKEAEYEGLYWDMLYRNQGVFSDIRITHGETNKQYDFWNQQMTGAWFRENQNKKSQWEKADSMYNGAREQREKAKLAQAQSESQQERVKREYQVNTEGEAFAEGEKSVQDSYSSGVKTTPQRLLSNPRIRRPYLHFIESCQVQQHLIFEFSEDLSQYVQNFRGFLHGGYRNRLHFRFGNATVDNLETVLSIIDQRMPTHVHLRDRMLQQVFDEGLMDDYLPGFTERKMKSVMEERAYLEKIWDDDEHDLKEVLATHPNVYGSKRTEISDFEISSGRTIEDIKKEQKQFAAERETMLEASSDPEGLQPSSEDLNAAVELSVLRKKRHILDVQRDFTEDEIVSIIERISSTDPSNGSKARKLFVSYVRGQLQDLLTHVVILREVGSALLGGLATLLRDRARVNSNLLQMQVGNIPFYQFMLNYTEYETLQQTTSQHHERNLIMSKLFSPLQESGGKGVRGQMSKMRSNPFIGITESDNPRYEPQNTLKLDAPEAMLQGFFKLALVGLSRIGKYQTTPVVNAIKASQKDVSQSYLYGEMTKDYFGIKGKQHDNTINLKNAQNKLDAARKGDWKAESLKYKNPGAALPSSARFGEFHTSMFDPLKMKFLRDDPVCRARMQERSMYPPPEIGIMEKTVSTTTRKRSVPRALKHKSLYIDGTFSWNTDSYSVEDLLELFEPDQNLGRGSVYSYLALRSQLDPDNGTMDCGVVDDVEVLDPLKNYKLDFMTFHKVLKIYLPDLSRILHREQLYYVRDLLSLAQDYVETKQIAGEEINPDEYPPEKHLHLMYHMETWQQRVIEISHIREVMKARIQNRKPVWASRLARFPGENHWDPLKCLEEKKQFSGSVASIFGNGFSWKNSTQNQAMEYLGMPLAKRRVRPLPYSRVRFGVMPDHEVDVASIAPQTVNCQMLREAVLSKHYTPKLWYVPFNPLIPPPLQQIAVGPDEHLAQIEWGEHATHCSLQMLVQIMLEYDYELIQVDHIFAVFKHNSYSVRVLDHPARLKSPYEHWLDGWWCSPFKAMGYQKMEYTFTYGNLFNLYPRSRFYMTDFLLRKTKIPEEIVKSGMALQSGEDNIYETFPTLYSYLVHRLFPKRFYYKNPGPAIMTMIEDSNRGRCVRRESDYGLRNDLEANPTYCECFAPFRGPMCQEEELRSPHLDDKIRTNENKHVIYYLLDKHDSHLWELQHALQNLWEKFNKYLDYPVVIWHSGIPNEAELEYANLGGLANVINDDLPEEDALRKWENSLRKSEDKNRVSPEVIKEMNDDENLTQIQMYEKKRAKELKFEAHLKEEKRKVQAGEHDAILAHMKRLAGIEDFSQEDELGKLLAFESFDEAYTFGRQMRPKFQIGGDITVPRRGRKGSKDKKGRSDISLLDIVAKSPNRIWLHLREKPYLPELSNVDREDHHRSYAWLEMIHFRSGPLYLTNVMQRFHLSWWLDSDAYFPTDARGYDPFADFERRNLILKERSQKYFTRNHMDDFVKEMVREYSPNAQAGSQEERKIRKLAEERFIGHVNEFVSDIELAWGYKILYDSQRTTALQTLWEMAHIWMFQHRHLMENKIFSLPDKHLMRHSGHLDGPGAENIREVYKEWYNGTKRAKQNPENSPDKDQEHLSRMFKKRNPTDSRDVSIRRENHKNYQLQLRMETEEFGSLYDEVSTISVEYPMGNTANGRCVMPNAITNSKYTHTPDTLYQRYVRYLNSLEGMFQSHGWGDHIVQTVGFAIVLRPLEVALNHSLVWNMTQLPYAHQRFVDCVGGQSVVVWDPDRGDLWDFKYKWEKHHFHQNQTNEHNVDERYIYMKDPSDDSVIKGTINIKYVHLIPKRWIWKQPFYTCVDG